MLRRRLETAHPGAYHTLGTLLLWVLRLMVGGAFALSGWAKLVDPQGFCLKIKEYLVVWNFLEVPAELVLTAALLISAVEFVTGVMILCGILRRAAPWTAALMMLVWLPLTTWLLIADPVDDCGCFGDFIILSNTATFLKNVALSIGVILLIIYNRRRSGLFTAPVQWLAVTACWIYAIVISYTGYQVQPLLDFRPFKTGTSLYEASLNSGEEEEYIYTHPTEGERTFTLDELPDSTWTFVRAAHSNGESILSSDGLEVYMPDGENATEELSDRASDFNRTLVLVIPDPASMAMTRSRYLNDLYKRLDSDGVDMYALLGGSPSEISFWQRLSRPRYDIYSAEETSLRMLVRGSSGVLWLDGDKILWKRNLSALDAELPYGTDPQASLEEIEPIDTGSRMMAYTILWLAALLLICALGHSPKALKLIGRRFHIRNDSPNPTPEA